MVLPIMRCSLMFNSRATLALCATIVLSPILAGCERRSYGPRIDCAEWAGKRYCFSSKVTGGIGGTSEEMTAAVYVPLSYSVLRKCNASSSASRSMVLDYDSVDVLMRSIWKEQTPDWLYETTIANQIGIVPPGWNGFVGPHCYPNQRGAIEGTTCIEGSKATNTVHVTSCAPPLSPGDVGVPSCFDTYVRDRVNVRINYARVCYPFRELMRSQVANYIQDHTKSIK